MDTKRRGPHTAMMRMLHAAFRKGEHSIAFVCPTFKNKIQLSQPVCKPIVRTCKHSQLIYKLMPQLIVWNGFVKITTFRAKFQVIEEHVTLPSNLQAFCRKQAFVLKIMLSLQGGPVLPAWLFWGKAYLSISSLIFCKYIWPCEECWCCRPNLLWLKRPIISRPTC